MAFKRSGVRSSLAPPTNLRNAAPSGAVFVCAVAQGRLRANAGLIETRFASHSPDSKSPKGSTMTDVPNIAQKAPYKVEM